MKKTILLLVVLGFAASLPAQKQNAAYLAYIDNWKETAIQNQTDYGVPASIIMAQALLESGAGQSELAQNANNHFGIKCTSDWFGGVYYHDDDSKGECFRQYYDAAESFKDHSLFLQRPRYATCFEITVEDYEGWAYRLKECGYATDKNYAPKLIKIIEDYRLDTLASGVPSGVYDPNARQSLRDKEPSGRTAQTKPSTPASNGQKNKATVVYTTEPIKIITNDPEPPYEAPLTAKEEKQLFFLQHPRKKCNGVTYVSAREGDTYASVAFRINVRERQLREWNDALGRDLQKGEHIFISAKKKKVPQEKGIMWVHPGEELWAICQREGIQMKQVQKLNGLDPEIRVFRTRQKIYLNKPPKENGGR